MVVICGPANMQNELISHVISHELATACRVVQEATAVGNMEGGVGPHDPNLVLIDALGDRHESILEKLLKCNRDIQHAPFWAIHNLARGAKIYATTLRKGVRGLFYTDDSLPLFVKGVRTLLEGGFWVSKRTLLQLTLDDSRFRVAMASKIAGLTYREIEILAHLSRGETNQEISDLLFVSPQTVKSHLYNVYRKINVNNRFQASLWAAENLY